MKTAKTNQPVLGVMVNSRTLHAILVQAESSGLVVLQRYVRQRNSRPAAAQVRTPSMANMVPELQGEVGGSDYTIQFGDGSGSSNDLFLKSEFGGLPTGVVSEKGEGDSNERSANFMYELSEILDECRQAGYERPLVAFCVASAEVAHVEMHVLPKKKGKGESSESKAANSAKEAKPASREQLLKLLGEQYKGDFDTDAVGFMPMMPSDAGNLRYLAIVPKKHEPVSVTLNAMRRQKDERPPNARLLDTEGSLFLGLARGVLRKIGKEGKGSTLLVRAGAEDTLLFFMEGERLRHYESMRSLTAFDSPDTICSRVLLQQDEYGVEEVHNVLLQSEEREDQLVESFRAFFPEANVTSIREHLPASGSISTTESGGAFVPALGVAMRLLGVEPFHTGFEDVNLLPKRLVRRKVELPFTWHTLVLSSVLFCTALFFGSRYVIMEQEIEEYRDMLRQYPPTLAEADPRALQARIDSMQNLYNGYIRALSVLDTLLVGSDQWSRGLEDLSRESSAVRGVWIDSWRPQGSRVTLTGNSTSRDRIVQIAERLEATIQSLTFSEIREWPVYSFVMTIPLEQELPEAALYLRERALEPAAESGTGDGAPAANELIAPAAATP
jgi:Tfp pilus assembly protein PilN